MTYPHPDAEDALERATLALFEELGWRTGNAYHELYSDAGGSLDDPRYLGRATRSEVILSPRLEAALSRLNPDLPQQARRAAYQAAVEELGRDRSAMTLADANREIYHLLKEGLPVTFRDPDGEEQFQRLRLMDWDEPANNDFLLLRQFWVAGEVYTRRADLVGFVNGLPLVFDNIKEGHPAEL
jgi:type I restriction enzyme R subunit